MAITTDKKSTVFGTFDAAGLYNAPDLAQANGHIHAVAGRASNNITNSNGSKYLLAELPWDVILQPDSAIMTTAWGFAQAVIGVDEATTGLLNVLKATGGATGNLPITIFGAKWNKPLWAQLGLAARPASNVAKLYAYAIADATIGGDLDFMLKYANYL